MNDKKWIVLGLIIFVGLFSFPLWYNMLIKVGKAAPAPEVVLTEKAKAAGKCVMSTEYMISEHMSLSNTCLDCHSNKTEFCDRCHDYASVRPYCWDCHIDNPKGEE